MFGICFLHCITQGGHVRPWLSNIFLSCVDGFVFISGYYGIRFRPSKVLTLYGIAFLCGLIYLTLGITFGFYTLAYDVKTLKTMKGILSGGWFTNAYVLCMLLAPLIDAALTYVPKRLLASVLVPFFLLTFGWGFGSALPIIGSVFPNASGIGAYTGLTLLSVYTVARLCRMLDVEKYFTWKRAFVLLLLLWGITGVGLGEYSSPFAVLLAATMFYVFKAIPFPQWVGTVASFLGPSMFSVYLLHSHGGFGFHLIKSAENILVDEKGINVYLVYFLVASSVFIGCTVLDMPRRFMSRLLRSLYTPLLRKVDGLYEKCIGR